MKELGVRLFAREDSQKLVADFLYALGDVRYAYTPDDACAHPFRREHPETFVKVISSL